MMLINHRSVLVHKSDQPARFVMRKTSSCRLESHDDIYLYIRKFNKIKLGVCYHAIALSLIISGVLL